MCTTVTLPTGEWLGSIAELRAHGISVTAEEQGDNSDDVCLCGVDVEMVLRRNGLRWRDEFAGGFLDLEAVPGG